MIVLYEHPLSPFSQKCKIALREKDIPFELRLPSGMGSGDTRSDPEFTAASPRGEVPALLDGDTRVFESKIILEYLEERWPGSPLLPAEPAERARVRMLADVMDSHFEPNIWAMGEITWFARATGERARRLMGSARDQCRRWLAWLEEQLGGRDWFNGAAFGHGDLSVIPFLDGAAGFDVHPPEDSRLAGWVRRVHARDAVARSSREAAESVPHMEGVAELVRGGAFRREYRDHRLEWMIRSGAVDIVTEGLGNDNIRFNAPFHR